MNIREPEVAAGVAIGEAFVIETEEVKNGRVEVVDVDRVFDHVHSQLIGRAINHTPFHAAASQKHRECGVVMIASGFLLFLVVLADFSVGRASEFAAPDDQRVVEQPALLEVRDERRGRLVAVPAKLAVIGIVFCAWLALRMNATHATIMAAVAVIGTANWLIVRSRPPLAPAIKTV